LISTPQQKRRALLMVIVFTFLAAVAQGLLKTGANRLKLSPSLAGLLTDFPLIGGLALYGIGAVLVVLALRHGQLSVLYPVISLTNVWVAVISVVIFHEMMNPFKTAGIAVIITGVAILGMGSHE